MIPELTIRENNICEMVARGMTNKEIGETLFISEYTVKSFLERISRKIGAYNRTHLAALYARGSVRALTNDQVVTMLFAMRKEIAKPFNHMGSIPYYRQEGKLEILDILINAIGAKHATPATTPVSSRHRA